jgi:2-polyprenyl-3-methyl-5-hydroxy-6-metoxy-1,4-benzoquinol methylase
MDRTHYRFELKKLEDTASSLPNNAFVAFGLTHALSLLILNWEKIMINRQLKEHPYALVSSEIKKTFDILESIGNASIFANAGSSFASQSHADMEEYHKKLFQALWIKFTPEDYKKRIEQYEYRLSLNKIQPFIKDKRCIDFGCGHGNFAHALVNLGAAYVLGIDYGEQSIQYCQNTLKLIGAKNIEFEYASVYGTGKEGESFDFALQNGVFHHLDDEDKAYLEVYRVLKPGGWFWIYTDGIDSIQGDIQDTCARILSKFNSSEIGVILDMMGLSVGKRYHLGDSLQATYRHTSLEDFLIRLKSYGFDNHRRLVGGYLTDSDGDAADDPWAREKFGSGDIRLLVQKI